MENSIHKNYIGNIGWSTNTKHVVNVEECNCEKFEGTHSHREAYAICASELGHHYKIGPVNQVRHTEPTKENITCKKCRKLMGWEE